MPRQGRVKQAFITSVAIASGIAIVQSITILTSWASRPKFYSVEELYEVREEIIAEIENPEETSPPGFFTATFLSFDSEGPEPRLIQELQEIEAQILIEHRAEDNWYQALTLGGKAAEIGLIRNPTVASRQEEQYLWQKAIENLEAIPPDSLQAEKTARKIQDYKESLGHATYQLRQVQANLLEEIRKESGLSKYATIVICNLQRRCMSLRGDEPPASPASLIKVPIAVALMHKLSEENISIDEEVMVQRANFTEDASEIRVRKRYPLKTIVGQTIARSSNIGTNQLIDYVGRDYINQVLEDGGYQVTRVNYKLIGNRIKPKNMGRKANRITSGELTEMMVQIYNGEHPGSDVLMEALADQKDRLLGYAGLEELKDAEWLGEKTGENSKAMGTTLAMNIGGQIYIVTVTDNRGGRDPQIRNCVRAIADYIINKGSL